MTSDQLRKAIETRPFKPFTIVMADGTRYRVPHPELVWIAPKAERTFVISDDEVNYTILDLVLVAAFEYGEGKATNGRRRR